MYGLEHRELAQTEDINLEYITFKALRLGEIEVVNINGKEKRS